jgi:allantoicase
MSSRSSQRSTANRVGADHNTPSFTALVDLASARVGGRAVATNDDFFASKSNLVKPEAAMYIPGKFTSRGKWMDGWESRRRRTPGHDWCIVALGMRGVVHGVNVDTSHFTGNFPSHCSIEALAAEKGSGLIHGSAYRQKADFANRPDPFLWETILARVELRGNSSNFFAIDDRRPWTHVRLNIFPDGGVARLRVYGEVEVDWNRAVYKGRAVDVASIENGGLVLGASDMHFGSKDNMIMPGRAINMGDGWETRRRRGPGYDWAVIRLGAPAAISRIEIDTNHFKGNYPESASIDGCLARREQADNWDALVASSWTEILPRTKLGPHRRHFFTKELRVGGVVSHVRLNIFPDGGISRLRVHGTVAAT